MSLQIRPASAYSVQQLVEIYNHTRSDYLVPMSMAPADLDEYLHVYDIALDGSVVALQDGLPVGLNLLGVRGDQGWVTRLGVASQARRQGLAHTLMQALLDNARRLGVRQLWLEVIDDNEAGRGLFQSFGFAPVARYVVAERANTDPTTIPARQVDVESVGRDMILEELADRDGHVDWKNHIDSLSKLNGLSGIKVESDDSKAWVAFRPRDHRIEKTVLGVSSGPVREMGWIALHHLGLIHSNRVLEAENVPMEGTLWDAYQRAGFQATFGRIEMLLSI